MLRSSWQQDPSRIRKEFQESGAAVFCEVAAETFLNRAKNRLADLKPRLRTVEHLEQFVSTPWKYLRLAELVRRFGGYAPRIAALVLLSGYVALAVVSYLSTLRPPTLALSIGLCQDRPCVSWLLPAGQGWHYGARPGMTVLSADGRSLSRIDPGSFPLEAIREVDLLTSQGIIKHVEVTRIPWVRAP